MQNIHEFFMQHIYGPAYATHIDLFMDLLMQHMNRPVHGWIKYMDLFMQNMYMGRLLTHMVSESLFESKA